MSPPKMIAHFSESLLIVRLVFPFRQWFRCRISRPKSLCRCSRLLACLKSQVDEHDRGLGCRPRHQNIGASEQVLVVSNLHQLGRIWRLTADKWNGCKIGKRQDVRWSTRDRNQQLVAGYAPCERIDPFEVEHTV